MYFITEYCEELKEVINRIIPLVDEIGEVRFQEYMRVYLYIKRFLGLNEDIECFFYRFSDYINTRKEINGYKRISLFGFKRFILNNSINKYNHN